MDTKQDFARRLTAALDYARVSSRPIDQKRYLAGIAGVTERHAGNYLSGEKLPTSEGMIKLAMRLGVSWEWLATGRGCLPHLALTEQETAVLVALGPEDRARLFQVGQVFTHQMPAASIPAHTAQVIVNQPEIWGGAIALPDTGRRNRDIGSPSGVHERRH